MIEDSTKRESVGANKPHIVSFFAFQGHFFTKLTETSKLKESNTAVKTNPN